MLLSSVPLQELSRTARQVNLLSQLNIAIHLLHIDSTDTNFEKLLWKMSQKEQHFLIACLCSTK